MARTFAAALTPLRENGASIDDDAFEPYLAFLAAGGIDGVLLFGTTGEGMNLAVDERMAALDHVARSGSLAVIAHCGAQTTAATVALCEHAASVGVAGVAVIAPPYFVLDEHALLAHFAAAARACAPTPFYAYELQAASGYAIPPAVIASLRDAADNLVGMKVSDAPFEKVAPYMLDGLEVFIGAEALIGQGLSAGAAGAVSGLASAFPEVVVDAVRTGDATAAGALRTKIERFPRHAALKEVVRARGVPFGTAVRPPLRGLTDAEREDLLASVL